MATTASTILNGQIAIVTGSGRGIGRAIAIALARQGAHVALVARSEQELRETAQLIAENSGSIAAVHPTDVADEASVNAAFASIARSIGPADLLVNNAGALGPLGPFAKCDMAAWWRANEVNLLGPALCARAVLPDMIARRNGRIVTVVSGAGANKMPPHFSAYVVSKTAAVRFTECLAEETRASGISVFAISPGTVHTKMADHSLYSDEGRRWLPWFGAIFDEGHNVPPERAAELVLALASGKADMLSGRYIAIADDLDRMIAEAERIARADLHVLRAAKLPID